MGSLTKSTSYGVSENGTLYQTTKDYAPWGDGYKVEYFGDPKATKPKAPDLTDEFIRASKKAELDRATTGNGRRSTFLAGLSPAPAKTVLGGLK